MKKMVLVPFKTLKQEGVVESVNHSSVVNRGDEDEHVKVEEHHVVNPLSEKLLSLDSFMEKVLKDDKLSDNEKIKEYGNAMQSYMEYKKKFSGSTQLVPIGTTSGEVHSPVITKIKSDSQTSLTQGGTEDVINNVKKQPESVSVSKIPFKTPNLKVQYNFDKAWLSW